MTNSPLSAVVLRLDALEEVLQGVAALRVEALEARQLLVVAQAQPLQGLTVST